MSSILHTVNVPFPSPVLHRSPHPVIFSLLYLFRLFSSNDLFQFRPWCVTVWSMLEYAISLIAYLFLSRGNIALTEVFKNKLYQLVLSLRFLSETYRLIFASN